jgi:uncharacterized protein (TIGR00255 family)
MLSMTGFGSGEATVSGVTITVELRSVNHRFLDVAVRLPAVLAPLESEVQKLLKERLARGRITCGVQLKAMTGALPLLLDENRLDQALTFLQEAAAKLAARTGRQIDITLDHLLAIPELFRSEESLLEDEAVPAALRDALNGAIDELLAMKEREGRELVAEMETRLGRLRGHLREVQRQVPQAAQEALTRLQARLAQLALDSVDPQRLAQEAALLADRSNINEECERLASHLEQFGAALSEGGQVAKRLHFLLQEMHREVNTMGSKTSLLAITQIVIAMKDEVESMREQVQNLE